MELVYKAAALITVLAAGAYTLNYARWCHRRGLRVGAAGLTLLAAVVVALPLLLLLRK